MAATKGVDSWEWKIPALMRLALPYGLEGLCHCLARPVAAGFARAGLALAEVAAPRVFLSAECFGFSRVRLGLEKKLRGGWISAGLGCGVDLGWPLVGFESWAWGIRFGVGGLGVPAWVVARAWLWASRSRFPPAARRAVAGSRVPFSRAQAEESDRVRLPPYREWAVVRLRHRPARRHRGSRLPARAPVRAALSSAKD